MVDVNGSLLDDERLEAVYGSSKKYGPYMCKDGRFRVDTWDGTKCSTRLLAKAVLEISLGRRLLSNETVDHIDGDKTNDTIGNLQILSLSDNTKKAYAQGLLTGLGRMIDYTKSDIGKLEMSTRAKGVKNPAAKLSESQVVDIRSRSRYQGLVRDLAVEFNVCRRTIQAIRKYNSYT